MPSFKPNRLAVVSLLAGDVTATVHFYRDVVGLGLLTHHGHRPALELGNGCFLVIVPGEPSGPRETADAPFPNLAFAVDDIDRAVERLEENGVEMPWGIETNAGDYWVKFYDPAGNLVEFVQFK